MPGQARPPLTVLRKDTLHDSHRGKLRFPGGFAEATENSLHCGIRVDSWGVQASAHNGESELYETLFCQFQKHLAHREVAFTLKAYMFNLISKLENIT